MSGVQGCGLPIVAPTAGSNWWLQVVAVLECRAAVAFPPLPWLIIHVAHCHTQPSGPTRPARARCSTASIAPCIARRSRQAAPRDSWAGMGRCGRDRLACKVSQLGPLALALLRQTTEAWSYTDRLLACTRQLQSRDEKIWQERLEKAAQQQQVGSAAGQPRAPGAAAQPACIHMLSA